MAALPQGELVVSSGSPLLGSQHVTSVDPDHYMGQWRSLRRDNCELLRACHAQLQACPHNIYVCTPYT